MQSRKSGRRRFRRGGIQPNRRRAVKCLGLDGGLAWFGLRVLRRLRNWPVQDGPSQEAGQHYADEAREQAAIAGDWIVQSPQGQAQQPRHQPALPERVQEGFDDARPLR